MELSLPLENKKYPPYLFDLDFDASALPPEPEIVEEAPPPPTFSSEELQAARDEGYASGKAEGLSQTQSEFDLHLGEIIAAIQHNFATLAAAQTETNETTLRDAVQVALAINKKLFPEYARRHGLDEIEAFILGTLSTLFSEAEITINVPEAIASEIAARLEPIAKPSGLSERLRVAADPTLGTADCKIEWGNGGAERNGELLMAEIETIAARFLDSHPQPFETPIKHIEAVSKPEPDLVETVFPDVETSDQQQQTAQDDVTGANEELIDSPGRDVEPEPSNDTPAAVPLADQLAEGAIEPEEPEAENPEEEIPAEMTPPLPKQMENQTAEDTPVDVPPTPAALPGAIDAS